MNIKIILKKGVFAFFVLSFFHFCFFYFKADEGGLVPLELPLNLGAREKEEPLFLSSDYLAISERLSCSDLEVFSEKLKEQLLVNSVIDRIDLPPSILLRGPKQQKVFEVDKKYSVSDLPLLADQNSIEGCTVVFKLLSKKVLAQLYSEEKMNEFFLHSAGLSEDAPINELDEIFKEHSITWYGSDLFLQHYAKNEYPRASHAQLLVLGSQAKAFYYEYVEEKESLCFEDNQWKVSRNTQDKPLLYLEKVEEETLKMTAWDSQGRNKKELILSKSISSSYPKHPKLSFVGAKSPTVWTVLCDGKRSSLRERDLWIYQEGRWSKIESLATFQNYLSFKEKGDLFVIEKLILKRGKKFVSGVWFNALRCQSKPLTFPLS